MEVLSRSLFTNLQISTSRVIYTPSPFARASLIHLQEVGTLQALEPHTSSRDGLQSYLFFVVLEGAGNITYRGKNHCLKKGDCVFIDCKNAYSHSSSEKLWSLAWIHFYGPTMNAIYDKYIERGGTPVFTSEDYSKYFELVQSVLCTASSDSYVRDVKIAEKLTQLISMLMEDAWNPAHDMIHTGRKRLSVYEIKDYIDKHYAEKLSLEELANGFYMNKQYLSKIFKEQFGITVNGYVGQVRISKAKSLLRFTEMSVEEIGASVGISDSNYFARTFKKIEGVTPSEYRRSW